MTMSDHSRDDAQSGPRGPNQALLGEPGSRERLCTPALVLDLEPFERNLSAMAAFARAKGVALRPHAKTHKSSLIARRQLEVGAAGICVATIGEAERLSAAGIGPLLVTSPLPTPAKLERLAALHGRTDGLMVVADSLELVDALGRIAAGADRTLEVLVDLGVGRQRTGCTSIGAARAVAGRIASSNTLAFGGVQAYAGNLQHVADFAERRGLDEAETTKLRELLDALHEDDIEVPRVTGGGTGTHAIDGPAGVFTELQCGSYLFMDVDYLRVALREDERLPFAPSLFVRTCVISANAKAHVTTDAGLKHFATDGPAPEIARGAPKDAVYRFFGDEHGRVELEDAARRLPVGSALECVTPHCDPTVNLHDWYHVVRGDTLVDLWPIDARGAS
jgi:3-hydroxy-D-aspartate aldolase